IDVDLDGSAVIVAIVLAAIVFMAAPVLVLVLFVLVFGGVVHVLRIEVFVLVYLVVYLLLFILAGAEGRAGVGVDEVTVGVQDRHPWQGEGDPVEADGNFRALRGRAPRPDRRAQSDDQERNGDQGYWLATDA